MSEQIDLRRRRFLGTAVAAASLGAIGSARAQSGKTREVDAKPRSQATFGAIKQIDAGALNVGYAEAGPGDGPAVILLHGWLYDIHSYVDVAPVLASAGYRVVIPYLRGYGTTRFLSSQTFRTAQRAAVPPDVIALMAGLELTNGLVGGFDGGARPAAVVATLWPAPCRAPRAVSGYLISNRT